MSNTALTPFWGMLISQSPVLLTYLIGILIAVARMPRNPRPAALVLIGCALLLASTVVGTLVQIWVFQNRAASVASTGQILMISNVGLAFVRAAAFVLLIVAAFVAREPEGSAFPVGQAAPGGPLPMAQRFG